MDVQTASGPALPLGIAVVVGVLALALAVALVVSGRRPPRAAALPPQAPAGTYPDDDLPAFREKPPGFPGARPVAAGDTARPGPVPVAGGDPVRELTVMALVALLLIGAAAAVAAVAAAAHRDPAGNPSSAPSTGTAAPAALMSVPVAPSSGVLMG